MLSNLITLSEVGGILCKGLFFWGVGGAVMGFLTCAGLLDTWDLLFVDVFVCKAHTDMCSVMTK